MATKEQLQMLKELITDEFSQKIHLLETESEKFPEERKSIKALESELGSIKLKTIAEKEAEIESAKEIK